MLGLRNPRKKERKKEGIIMILNFQKTKKSIAKERIMMMLNFQVAV